MKKHKVLSLHKRHEEKMNASYKKLWKLLIDRDLNKTTLQKMAGISSVSMAKLSKNENVTTDILVKICSALKCDFSDIMEMEELPGWREKDLFTTAVTMNEDRPGGFSLGELFCGPGGLAVGALTADIGSPEFFIKHKWSNDFDDATCQTYRHNICPKDPGSVICQDVRTLDLENLPPVDALAFGFPCNDFSVVGEQKGFAGTYGPLYTYGVRVLKSHHPKWFLAENVGGLTSANEGRAFSKILTDLQAAGYRIYPHLYKFEEYGVPQARHRVIIVGIRQDLPFVYRVPDPSQYAGYDNSCRNALENPPIPVDAPNSELTKQDPRVVERLRYIKPGQNAFTASLPPELQLHVRGAKISQIYKRLDPDKPSYTVTGSGGGGTHIYHYSEPRALTNRERARLQTFPDSFEFLGSKESVRKQIGMAVPCCGARIIFEAILKTFAGLEYASVPCNVNLKEMRVEE